MRIVIYIFSFLFASLLSSQEGLHLNIDGALESYTLFDNEDGAYLIDNCGRIINEWPGLSGIDNHLKFLNNGNLLFISNNSRIYELDWEGNILKNIQIRNPNIKLDYEVIKLDNGNYLCAGRYMEDNFFFTENAYNQALGFPMYDDAVFELDGETGDIVWEWRISDHIIQQRDSAQPNYGLLEENPGKIDVDAISTFDWYFDESFMINGMDYNPDLDQIALSIRKVSEVVIIDHSTTTEEAKTNEGGTYGKGGDILYRWGNPQNYNQGSANDRVLYYQHNPNWILHGAHKNKLIIYNNGLDRPISSFDDRYSDAVIVDTEVNVDGSYTKEADLPFSPLEAEASFSGQDFEFYSGYTSAAQVLPNGNIFITVGGSGHLLEITSDRELVWDYNIPNNRFNFFRAEKYSVDHPAFNNRTLSPGKLLVNGSYQCDGSSTKETPAKVNLTIIQAGNHLEIFSDNSLIAYEIYNAAGQRESQEHNLQQQHQVDISHLTSGLYYIKSFNKFSIQTESIFIK